MKLKYIVFFILLHFIVACNSPKENGESQPELTIEDVNIYTQKPLINVNDTVFFSVTYNSNFKRSSSGIEVSLNGKTPVGTKLEYNEISATEYKGYFLPIKEKGEYNLNVNFTKNGKSFSFGKKIKITDSYLIGDVWEELNSFDEIKAIAPFATFKDNYPYTYTNSSGSDFINLGFFLKEETYQFANPTKIIEGFYGKYSLIYDTNKTLAKIRLQNAPTLINYKYQDIFDDLKNIYGDPLSSGANQYTGFKFSEFETTTFKIRIEQISHDIIYTDITKK